jgi:hypothetical protein
LNAKNESDGHALDAKRTVKIEEIIRELREVAGLQQEVAMCVEHEMYVAVVTYATVEEAEMCEMHVRRTMSLQVQVSNVEWFKQVMVDGVLQPVPSDMVILRMRVGGRMVRIVKTPKQNPRSYNPQSSSQKVRRAVNW